MEFSRVDYPEPHFDRTRRMFAAHPELRSLCGNTPSTALFVVALVAAQVAAAWCLRDAGIWWVIAAAWLFGAFVDHGLWVLIHECTHNLVFRRARSNAVLQIVANLPLLFPGGAMSFRKYHLLHHRFQGDLELDADLASPLEARLVGNGVLGKAFWLFNFWVFQSLRVTRLRRIRFFDLWYLANLLVELAFIGAVVWWLGWTALAYLFLSSIFAIGMHPVGARWIQEHYTVAPPQETYSYYGPLNLLAFNVGYHNEHHDVMRVPWSRLPKVRAIAPEFYAPLRHHRSWTALWLRFLFDRRLSLYSRIVRTSRSTAPVVVPVADDAPVREAAG
jgi:sphingolipid delta-4 desaturase